MKEHGSLQCVTLSGGGAGGRAAVMRPLFHRVFLASALAGIASLPGAAGENIEARSVPTARRASGSPVEHGCPRPLRSGPDVVVGELSDARSYGSVAGAAAFAFGTISCNLGDTPLAWVSDEPHHPVIGLNLYRLHQGRFEQVGLSWLKHGFFVTASAVCCSECLDTGEGLRLDPGCSDPYDAALNGAQNTMGPRFEVNPHDGVFPYPYSGINRVGNATFKRLQVPIADIDPQLHGGGLYFAEAQYVAADDSAAGNQNNNASYRQVAFDGSLLAWQASFENMPPTQREQPALRAWQDHDPEVVETDVQIPGEGLFVLAAKATPLDNGYWHYEYALQNLNSDRAAGSFSVPLVPGAGVDRAGFHDIDYHSGEPFDGTDWIATRHAEHLSWSTVSFEDDPMGNALRWGTVYNFRFECNAAPGSGEVAIGLFKPGDPAGVTASSVVPLGTVPACGDGRADAGEECDPPQAGQCDDTCQRLPQCGDGVLDGAEECDPPDGLHCSATCAALQPCGNGEVDVGEECDPPDGRTCDNTCRFPAICGDGRVGGAEQCDPPDGQDCSLECRACSNDIGPAEGCPDQPGEGPDQNGIPGGSFCGLGGAAASGILLAILLVLQTTVGRLRMRDRNRPS